MDCIKYRKLTHELLDNEISENSELELIEHLEHCQDCKIYMLNINKIKLSIKDSYGVKKNDINLSAQIMKKIQKRPDARTTSFKLPKKVSKVAIIIVIFSAIFIAKTLFSTRQAVALNDTDEMIMEHLEKSNNNDIIHVTYAESR
jgi:predicted anti-sigma-YlaC factor YlaD